MKRQILTVFAFLTLFSVSVTASNYPPDYAVCSVDDFEEDGPFTFIQHQKGYGTKYGLTIAYDGFLRDSFNDDEIQFWVRINGQEAMLQARAGNNNDAYVWLWAGVRNCFMIPTSSYNMTWKCTWAGDTESHLFKWTHNNNGRLNAWDIEVAATAGGQWDSNWGNNFSTRFPEKFRCQ